MILNEIDSYYTRPCEFCHKPLGEIHQIFRIPTFEPYIDKTLDELKKIPEEAHKKAAEFRAYSNCLVHRHCWFEWTQKKSACSLAIQALKHEFGKRNASCIAESDLVVAYSTQGKDSNLAPGVLFLPGSGLVSRHLLGINVGDSVVRDRGECVEALVNALAEDKVTPGFGLQLSLHTEIDIQCVKEVDNTLQINFASSNEIYAVYFLYKPDIELLKQAKE
ncbi:MAG: hypothetical protein J7540_06310 [Roseofilum sp. SID2]|uniref:hypothetical protein n=1 Tax=Roseofilum sp. SID2 TaxID=2821498 RepID=UPI001B14527A|nr:hypothetical protein [Roseofilum sp. SID2]MBP0023597.1 hypothetical protein [Roseofilum sp. SID2]